MAYHVLILKCNDTENTEYSTKIHLHCHFMFCHFSSFSDFELFYLIFYQFGRVPEDQVQLINRMYAWPHKIHEDFRLAEARLSHKRDLKETALKARVAAFEKT